MFCENCGVEIKEGDTFCTNCGHRIVQNSSCQADKSMPVMTGGSTSQSGNIDLKVKKKSRLPIILALTTVALAAIVIFVLVVAGNNSTSSKVKKQLQLAQRYLEELNYEQAVAAYEKAIEIDPMCTDAYLGLADIYEQNGEYELAIEILKKGIEVTGDETLRERLDQVERIIADQEIANRETDQQITEETNSEAEETYATEELNQVVYAPIDDSEMVNQIITLFEQERYEDIYNIAISDEFNGLRDEYSGIVGYYGTFEDNNPCGETLLIYGDGVKRNSILYIGFIKNGLRNGKGMAVYRIIYGDIEICRGYYIGNWENDVQSGDALQTIYSISSEDGSVSSYVKYVGTAKNGLAEGDFSYWYPDSVNSGIPGRAWAYEYYCKEGVPQGLGEIYECFDTENEIYFSEEAMCRVVLADGTRPCWHEFGGLSCKDCSKYDHSSGPWRATHPWAGWEYERVYSFLNAD